MRTTVVKKALDTLSTYETSEPRNQRQPKFEIQMPMSKIHDAEIKGGLNARSGRIYLRFRFEKALIFSRTSDFVYCHVEKDKRIKKIPLVDVYVGDLYITPVTG